MRGLVMANQTDRQFTKEVTFLPDGRQLIYYNFVGEAEPAAPGNPPPQKKEEGE
jgi:hypothetical protein